MNSEEISPEMLAAASLYEVFGFIQNRAWQTLPAKERRIVESLTARQVKTIMTVYVRHLRGELPLTLNELAVRLCIGKAAASILVSALVEKEMLCRETDPENRRFVRITRSEKGKKISEAVLARASALNADFIGEMTECERKVFASVSSKLYKRYTEELG